MKKKHPPLRATGQLEVLRLLKALQDTPSEWLPALLVAKGVDRSRQAAAGILERLRRSGYVARQKRKRLDWPLTWEWVYTIRAKGIQRLHWLEAQRLSGVQDEGTQ